MAGHSKWANIQHRKNRQDAKRGSLWTKIIREVTVAARDGGADPDMNPRLRLALDKARLGNVRRTSCRRRSRAAAASSRRELRGDPLRGLRHRRRGGDDRLHDRQTAPAPPPRCGTR